FKMEVPPEITFRGLEKSPEIETHILKKAAKLDEIHPGIISCRVAVESEQEHQRSGSPYRVRVIVRIPPNKELVGRREPGAGKIDDRLQTAVTEAFNAVQRQLVKTKEMQQGKVKSAPAQELIGHVVRLFREEGYGFIRSVDGREIYFHKNAVLQNDFERLEIGTGVRYFPSEGEEGPQASTVQIVDKPGSRASKVGDPQVEPPEGWGP
ncbi:MAG: HPF/RaiA family ribosome-associated protein, partial [Desulfobacterales bacterium]